MGVRRLILIPLGLVALGLAIALAGCGGDGGTAATAPRPSTPAQQQASSALDKAPDLDRSLRAFSVHMTDEMQAFWRKALRGSKFRYQPMRLVITEQGADTACDFIAEAAYCPDDRTMVIALPFMRDELVGGDDTGRNDGAVAAVLAHEFAHHLQAITGIDERLYRIELRDPETANVISVVRELHADCIAGSWLGMIARDRRVSQDDVEEIMGMLSRIGADSLAKSLGQEQDWTQYTHGTAWLRKQWFLEGFENRNRARGCAAIMSDFYQGMLVQDLMRDLGKRTTAPAS